MGYVRAMLEAFVLADVVGCCTLWHLYWHPGVGVCSSVRDMRESLEAERVRARSAEAALDEERTAARAREAALTTAQSKLEGVSEQLFAVQVCP